MVLFLIPLIVCGNSVEQTEQLFYYAFDEKVPIEIVPGKFMVKKKRDVSKEEAVAIISSCLDKAAYDWFNDDICTVLTDDGMVGVAVRRLLNDDAFLSVRPVYILTKDKEYFQKHDIGNQPLAVGMIDQITMKYKDGVGESVRDSINKLFESLKIWILVFRLELFIRSIFYKTIQKILEDRVLYTRKNYTQLLAKVFKAICRTIILLICFAAHI